MVGVTSIGAHSVIASIGDCHMMFICYASSGRRPRSDHRRPRPSVGRSAYASAVDDARGRGDREAVRPVGPASAARAEPRRLGRPRPGCEPRQRYRLPAGRGTEAALDRRRHRLALSRRAGEGSHPPRGAPRPSEVSSRPASGAHGGRRPLGRLRAGAGVDLARSRRRASSSRFLSSIPTTSTTSSSSPSAFRSSRSSSIISGSRRSGLRGSTTGSRSSGRARRDRTSTRSSRA